MAFDDETVTFCALERSGTGQFHIECHHHEISFNARACSITFRSQYGPNFRVTSRLMIRFREGRFAVPTVSLAADHHRRTPWDSLISCVDQASRSN
jgi:hypothetical protein